MANPLNAPNDVVVASDGSVWFTDPGYGIMSDYEGRQAPFELPTAVYRLDPDRAGPSRSSRTSNAPMDSAFPPTKRVSMSWTQGPTAQHPCLCCRPGTG